MTIVPVTAERLDALAIGDCIQCLGSHPNHTLEIKFAALQAAGFKTTEFSFAEYFQWVKNRAPERIPDVDPESFGNEAPRDGDEAAWETLYRYADEMKALAAKHGVEMRSLQCLGQVDTWPEGSDREKWGFAKAIHWITLCHHLGLEFCQVGVNDQYEATAPFGKTVADLGYIADEAAKHNVKIAYESWNFAPRMSQWEGTWNVVKAANRANLGLCIDTAQCALAPQYGFDPTSGNGFTEPAVQALLARLRALPAEKIFFVEISDVLKPQPPLLLGSPFDEWHKQQGPGYRTGFTWCRCARVIPHVGRGTGKLVSGAEGLGGGRTAEIVKAILETGFNGPMYFECFEVSEQENAALEVPDELAQAAALSWSRMREAMLAE